jgi:enoyl-CoA hydratase/carnithine racemase
MSDRVLTTVTDGIADVRLNRPDKLNALDGAMFQALADAGEALKGDRGVRVVVLSGEGRGFCAGLDFGAFQSMAGGDAPSSGDAGSGGGLGAIGRTDGRITHLGQQACWVWQELEVPVIAAVHGPALGGGIQIALGADIRIVAPDAKLSVLESRTWPRSSPSRAGWSRARRRCSWAWPRRWPTTRAPRRWSWPPSSCCAAPTPSGRPSAC